MPTPSIGSPSTTHTISNDSYRVSQPLTANIRSCGNTVTDPVDNFERTSPKESSMAENLTSISGLTSGGAEKKERSETDCLKKEKLEFFSTCIDKSGKSDDNNSLQKDSIISILSGYDASVKANTTIQGSAKLNEWMGSAKIILSSCSPSCKNTLDKIIKIIDSDSSKAFQQAHFRNFLSSVHMCPGQFTTAQKDNVEKLLKKHLEYFETNDAGKQSNLIDDIKKALPKITTKDFEYAVTTVINDIYKIPLPDLSRLNVDTKSKFKIFNEQVEQFIKGTNTASASDLLSQISEIYSFFENLSNGIPKPDVNNENTIKKEFPKSNESLQQGAVPQIIIYPPDVNVTVNGSTHEINIGESRFASKDKTSSKKIFKVPSQEVVSEHPEGSNPSTTKDDKKGLLAQPVIGSSTVSTLDGSLTITDQNKIFPPVGIDAEPVTIGRFKVNKSAPELTPSSIAGTGMIDKVKPHKSSSYDEQQGNGVVKPTGVNENQLSKLEKFLQNIKKGEYPFDHSILNSSSGSKAVPPSALSIQAPAADLTNSNFLSTIVQRKHTIAPEEK